MHCIKSPFHGRFMSKYRYLRRKTLIVYIFASSLVISQGTILNQYTLWTCASRISISLCFLIYLQNSVNLKDFLQISNNRRRSNYFLLQYHGIIKLGPNFEYFRRSETLVVMERYITIVTPILSPFIAIVSFLDDSR